LSLAALPLLFCAVLAGCSSDASSSTTQSSSATQSLDGTYPDAGGPVPGGPYPAFSSTAPQLALHGGSVLRAPKFQLVRYASDTTTAAATLIQKMGASSYWSETTSEYGVGPAIALPEVAISGVAPAKMDDTDVTAWLTAQLDDKNTAGLAAPDGETVYVWSPPSSMVITQGGSKLCKEVGGYHSTFKRGNGEAVPYIVVPHCSRFDDLVGVDALTFSLSHEMIEAATDPFSDTGYHVAGPLYYAFAGGEAGDLCELTSNNSVRPEDIGLLVQRTWSNRAALAGHEPCVPAAGVVTFGAFAAQSDHIGDNPAITIPNEKTIQVQLWSDAPMDTFAITAADLAQTQGKKPELTVTFPDGSNSASGKNGDILELTVKPIGPGTYPGGASVLLLEATSANGKSQHLWASYIRH